MVCIYNTLHWYIIFQTRRSTISAFQQQPLEIGDWKTWGCRVINAHRLRLICSMIFECPFRFVLLVHRILPTFMDLHFYFAAIIWRFANFGLTSNMLVNKHSDFLVLGFLTVVDIIYTLWLLSVTSLGVDTIAASRISLRFCWSSHLPACWYIF